MCVCVCIKMRKSCYDKIVPVKDIVNYKKV